MSERFACAFSAAYDRASVNYELREVLSRNRRLRPVAVQASEVLVGDILVQKHRSDTVVRMYPNGQSGLASFCEISFGSVCVAIPRDEMVMVCRDQQRPHAVPAIWSNPLQGWVFL